VGTQDFKYLIKGWNFGFSSHGRFLSAKMIQGSAEFPLPSVSHTLKQILCFRHEERH
jgi:hypothetical protein